MKDEHNHHVALYGNTKMQRATCPDCNHPAFIIDNEFACCGLKVKIVSKAIEIVRETNPHVSKRRVMVPIRIKKLISMGQNNKCFYCKREFGSAVMIRRKLRILSIQWDHIVPYVYSKNNSESNIVAACSICNAWKRAIMFDSIEKIKEYLNEKWKAELNRYRVSELSEDV